MTTIQSSLRQNQHILIRQLADSIETIWKGDLNLSPYDIPEDLGYVEGSLEGERLVIENHCYQTREFRKLHLELAKLGNNVDILHCVMFPRTNFDLPIFGADIVGARGNVGAAIVDLSPVKGEPPEGIGEGKRLLPPNYRHLLANLAPLQFSEPRDLPVWGNIFSEFCLFVRPTNSQEEEQFLTQVKNFLTIHCQIATSSSPVSSTLEKAAILAGQKYYCTQQQKNDKTRKILEKSLGKQWTDRYITNMLFDMPE